MSEPAQGVSPTYGIERLAGRFDQDFAATVHEAEFVVCDQSI
jgi:hypothetical protein